MPSLEKREKWHRFDNWGARLLFKWPTLICLCVRQGCVKPPGTWSTRVVYRLGAFVVWLSVRTFAADNRLKHDERFSGPWGDAPWTLQQLPSTLWHGDTSMMRWASAEVPSDETMTPFFIYLFIYFLQWMFNCETLTHLRFKLSCDVARLQQRHQFSNLGPPILPKCAAHECFDSFPV